MGHSDHFPTQVACIVQHRLRAVRSIEPWNIEQSSVWLDDVKIFSHRSMRCMIVVHPYTFLQDPGPPSAYLSTADPVADGSFTTDLQKDKLVTLNKQQKKTLTINQTSINEADDTMWNLLTNTIPHGRTIMLVITPDTEMCRTAVGQTDPGF